MLIQAGACKESSVPVHALESDCGCGVLAVQATEDPELEVGVHGDRHNCHKYVDRRLLRVRIDSTQLCCRQA